MLVNNSKNVVDANIVEYCVLGLICFNLLLDVVMILNEACLKIWSLVRGCVSSVRSKKVVQVRQLLREAIEKSH